MAPFHEILATENAGLLERARIHRLFTAVATGTIQDDRFLAWLAQNYLWVREYERFVMTFALSAPDDLRDALSEALLGIHIQTERFEELYAKVGPSMASVRPGLACHSFTSFLTATAHTRSFEEALTACYGANSTFHAGWTHARTIQKPESQWKEFISLWTDEGFKGWIDALAGFIDPLAEKAPAEMQDRMREIFGIAIHYNLRFWNTPFDPGDR